MYDRYFTFNSIYIIDLPNLKYYRLPLTEAGRQSWEMMTENMVDGKWLDLEDIENPVQLIEDPQDPNQQLLQIRYKGSHTGLITSPVIMKKIADDGCDS